MKNKITNILLTFTILMALLVSPAMAEDTFVRSTIQQMPYILEGNMRYEVDGLQESIGDVRVYVKNVRTGYVTYTHTNDNGYFVFSLQNLLVNYPFDKAYDMGDRIQVYMTNNKIFEFQIGGKELCVYHGGEDCESLASSQGGHHINFNLASNDLVYYEPIKEEVSVSEWYQRHKEAVNTGVTVGIVAILCGAMYALYLSDKKKYSWMPGMGGILKYHLREWVKLKTDPNYKPELTEEDIEKKRKTIYKTANTITRKYINSVTNGDIEPKK